MLLNLHAATCKPAHTSTSIPGRARSAPGQRRFRRVGPIHAHPVLDCTNGLRHAGSTSARMHIIRAQGQATCRQACRQLLHCTLLPPNHISRLCAFPKQFPHAVVIHQQGAPRLFNRPADVLRCGVRDCSGMSRTRSREPSPTNMCTCTMLRALRLTIGLPETWP